MSTGKILLGVLAGAAVGALVGVLMAPDKGTETRKKIMKKGGDYSDALRDKFDDLVSSMTDKFENVKSDTKAIAHHGKAKVNEFKKGNSM
jgi:gas vesicle protein